MPDSAASAPAAAAAPTVEIDPRIIAAIDALKWAEAADRIEDFYVVSPSSGAWIIQYVPVLRAAAEGQVEDAAFMLHPGIYENTAPPAIHQRMVLNLARALEGTNPWCAAGLYHHLADPRMVERGNQLARKVGGKPEDVPVKFYEQVAGRAQVRLGKNPEDAMALEWQALALAASDPDTAFTTAERAVRIDPTIKRAWMVLAEIGQKAGRSDRAAVVVYQDAAEANAGAAWPFVLLARPYADHDFERALKYVDRALQSDPQDMEACELRRRMLRKLERWSELVEQLQYMCSLSGDRLKLAEWYEEWGRTLSDPMKDPIGAIEVQKEANFYANAQEVSDFYWKKIQENEKDKRAWDEVDDFFRQNRMWADLGKLLVMRLERAMGDDRLVYIDQLRIVWAMVPDRGDLSWADVVEAEIERVGDKDAEMKKALQDRLESADVPPPEKPPADIAGYVMIAAGVLVVVVILLVAVLLMPFFVQ